VRVKNSTYCFIENNEILKAKPRTDSIKYAALEIQNSYDCEIVNNTVKESSDIGISVCDSSSITVYHNYVFDNKGNGIEIAASFRCTISFNDVTDNQDGIEVHWMENCTISFNNIYYNRQYGISVGDSSNLSISNNTIHHHAYVGVLLVDSSYCVIAGNEVYENLGGIYVGGSMRIPWTENKRNIVTKNNIHHNEVGIYLGLGRKNSFIINNLIENSRNAWFKQSLWLGDPNPPFPLHNTWLRNYWSDWHLPFPKPIAGYLSLAIPPHEFRVPWLMFDWHPAMEPWEIG
jgi:parallel beta-helix repeat protein